MLICKVVAPLPCFSVETFRETEWYFWEINPNVKLAYVLIGILGPLGVKWIYDYLGGLIKKTKKNGNEGRKMKMKLKYNIGFFILIICLMLSGCRVIPYSRNDVKNFVASEVPEPCTLVNERTYNVTDKSYTFRSELRDLEFDVDCNISDNNGYHMISHYGAAVYLYYDEDLKEVYEKCSCRNGNPFEFEIQNEEDLREVSKTIAELNTVISDQWNYTPGLELTDPDILAIRVTVDVMKDGSAKRTSYTLNGYDKEDEVYSQFKNGMVNS